MNLSRSRLLVPALMLVLTVGAIGAVWLLMQRSDESRRQQVRVASLTLALTDLQSAPFTAEPGAGSSPTASRAEIKTDERAIVRGLMVSAQSGVSRGLLASGRAKLGAIEPIVTEIYGIAVNRGGFSAQGVRTTALQKLLRAHAAALSAVLGKVGNADATRAQTARLQAKVGAAAAMLLLLAAFAFFYFRAIAARGVVERLAEEKTTEARTDALTHLGNRRALNAALAGVFAGATRSQDLLFVIFDLDGFKVYNDTFGHAAGDALLERLGGRLAAALVDVGAAYRIGGDEFCALIPCTMDAAATLLEKSVAAMEESGEGWHVGCSHGAVWLPSEAATQTDALRLADERMYADKVGRSSASRQVTDSLPQVMTEQGTSLGGHVERVAKLSASLGSTAPAGVARVNQPRGSTVEDRPHP